MLLSNITEGIYHDPKHLKDYIQEEVRELKRSWEVYSNRKLARDAKLRLFQQVHQDYEIDFRRASGLCLCEHCGLTYRLHPYNEELAVNRLCNGEFVHL